MVLAIGLLVETIGNILGYGLAFRVCKRLALVGLDGGLAGFNGKLVWMNCELFHGLSFPKAVAF
ncbi:hypothetical protein JJB98_13190 [Bradyrhizobium diazoefficiens]|nr:hypothetical protein [Bradyrhizobium diazoefficiens]QQO20796.1 hypothetical protein JJB98_13190 [Bradyrhizobium diazoefficiens]